MAKGQYPAFLFYPDAWLSSGSIMLMSPAEEGAYIRLLALAWMTEDASLPDDDEQLAILSRLGSQWKKSSRRIRKNFTSNGEGRLFNERLLEERQRLEQHRRASAEGGRKSAEHRKGNQNSRGVEVDLKGTSIPVPRNEQPEVKLPITITSSITREEIKTSPQQAAGGAGSSPKTLRAKPSEKQRTPEIQTWFEDEYWPIWPRKIAKEEARAAAEHVATTPELRAAIIRSVQHHMPELLRREESRRPYPATFLNSEGFDDFLTPAQADMFTTKPLTNGTHSGIPIWKRPEDANNEK